MANRDPLTTEKLARRAEGLQKLGSSPARIRAILSGLNVTPEQVDEVMAGMEAAANQRKRADSNYLWLLGGLSIFLIVVVFALGYIPRLAATAETEAAPKITPKPGVAVPNGPSNAPTATLSPQSIVKTLAPNVPLQLIPSLLPSNIPANFRLATSAVVQEPTQGVVGKCPKAELDAARLFGGEPKNWSYDIETNGWTMTVVGPGVEIHVPEGMSAGFLELANGPEMKTAHGPVTLTDVNFVAISCP